MSDDEEFSLTPPEITERATNAVNNILPDKSKKAYEKLYGHFMDWRDTKNISSFSENVLIVYFEELMNKMKPSSLWTHYSIIKSVLNIKHNVDISKYRKLYALLKRKSQGFVSKKSKTFSPDEIRKFLDEAPDNRFLFSKVALIFGIIGACRRRELYSLRVENVHDTNGILFVNIVDPVTKIQRTFTITGKYYDFCKQYINLRPAICSTPFFFINYNNGKCTMQNVGINKFGSLGKQIATYLELPDAKSYTGHCFRRTSANVLVDSGGDITTLKRLGGSKSTMVAESYIENRSDKIDINLPSSSNSTTTRTGTATQINSTNSTNQQVIHEQKTRQDSSQQTVSRNKRQLSLANDDASSVRRKKGTKNDVHNNKINLYNDIAIKNIITELNILFPIGWCFFSGIKQIIAIQLDPLKFKERIRLIIDVDGSVMVTYIERRPMKLNLQIQSVDDLINCLKSMEQKKVCAGTGFDKKSYSLKCFGNVTDTYKRCQTCPRCPDCRKLRLALQKLKKSRKSKTTNEIIIETAKDAILKLHQKTKLIQQELKFSICKLHNTQKKSKTIHEGHFNRKIALLPKQQQMTVKMCFDKAKKKDPTGRRYEVEWMYECLLIRMNSTCTYNMIRARNIIPLPTIDQLTKYVQNISSSIFGFLPETFEILRRKGELMDLKDKVGQLLADEVKLKENIGYNKEIAEYTGFGDLCKYSTDSQGDFYRDHALVFMYVPYRGNSPQALGCFITNNSITSEVLHKLFLECIILIENAGFRVNALVTNAAQWNRGVRMKLGINTDHISCEHPCDSSRKLWMISDFPYLMKCFWNALIELDEFETPVGLVKKNYWKNLLLVEQYEKLNLGISYKLTPAHLDPKQFQKMSVPMVYQLYSREVHCAMTVLRENGNELFEGSEPTERFIKIVADAIQAMASHDARNSLYLRDDCENRKAIKTFLQFLDDWEKMFTGTIILAKPFPISVSILSGFKITLCATLEILSELHKDYDYEYLSTFRLTQDNLQRLFSIIRYYCGANDHPTPQQFGQVFRLYGCNAMIKPSKGSNITSVELLQTLMKTKDLLEMSHQPRMEWLQKIDQMLENAISPDEIWMDIPSETVANIPECKFNVSVAETSNNLNNDSETIPSTSYTTEDSLEDHAYDVINTSREVQAYITGYIVRKFNLKCKCVECLKNLEASGNEVLCRDSFIDLMEKYGGLSRASDDLCHLTMQVEAAFLDVVGREGLSHGIMYKILNSVQTMLPQLRFVGCSIHQQERTTEIIDFYIIMRLHFLKKVFNKKTQLEKGK